MKDFYENIDDYIAGSLSSEMKTEFEQAMISDSVLRAAVENYDLGKQVSEGLLELDMMETLAGLKQDSKNGEKPLMGKSIVYKVIAFVLAFILMGLLYKAYENYKIEQENKLWYAEVYQRPIDPDATKSIDTVGMDMLQKGKFFFALNDFEQSEAVLRNLLENTSDSDTTKLANFWLGQALVGQGKWEGRGMIE